MKGFVECSTWWIINTNITNQISELEGESEGDIIIKYIVLDKWINNQLISQVYVCT